MAIVYRGAGNELDERMLEVLERLPDEYHIFTTFRVPGYGREIDFLVIRQDPDFGGIFCLEVKDETRRLRGTYNGPWEYQDDGDGIWMPYPRPNSEDDNPLQQAYSNAALFKRWLSSMRDLIQDPDDQWPPEQIQKLAVFPRLVLSRAHEHNQIQYDNWVIRFDMYEEVISGRYALPRWRPKEPFYFSDSEIERIAQQLGMQRDGRPREVAESVELDDQPLPERVAALTAEVRALRDLVRKQSAMIQDLRVLVQQHEGTFARFAEVFSRRGQTVA